MATKITKWQDLSGALHDTETEALDEDCHAVIEKALQDAISYDLFDYRSFREGMRTNKQLRAALLYVLGITA